MSRLTSWFHNGFGVTVAQVVQILSCHLQTQITPGGLVQGWYRLVEILATYGLMEAGDRQVCLAHLLRKVQEMDDRNGSAD